MVDSVDFNPCDVCSPHADCVKGQCKCKHGFIGDGQNCTGKSHLFNKVSKVLESKSIK